MGGGLSFPQPDSSLGEREKRGEVCMEEDLRLRSGIFFLSFDVEERGDEMLVPRLPKRNEKLFGLYFYFRLGEGGRSLASRSWVGLGLGYNISNEIHMSFDLTKYSHVPNIQGYQN